MQLIFASIVAVVFPLHFRLRVQNARSLCWVQHPNLRPLPPEGERAFLAWRLCEVCCLPAASVGDMLLPQPAALLQTWLRKVSSLHLLISFHLASECVRVCGYMCGGRGEPWERRGRCLFLDDCGFRHPCYLVDSVNSYVPGASGQKQLRCHSGTLWGCELIGCHKLIAVMSQRLGRAWRGTWELKC